MKELPEELANELTNLPSLFCRLLYSNEDTEKVAATLRDSARNLNLVEKEIISIYGTYPELGNVFFNYLSDEINNTKRQIDDKALLFYEKRENILNRLSEIVYNVFKKSIKSKSNNCFVHYISPGKQRVLFDELIKGGYITETTNYDLFCFVFGGTKLDDKNSFSPITWLKTQDLLAYMVYKIFSGNVANLWAITQNCFILYNTKKHPNTNTIKKNVCQWSDNSMIHKNLPKGYDKIDEIIQTVGF